MRRATPTFLTATPAPRACVRRAFGLLAFSLLFLLAVLASGCGGQADGVRQSAAAAAKVPGSSAPSAMAAGDGRAFRLAATSSVGDVPILLQPLAGQTVQQSSTPFRWSAVAGAEAYYLWVGTSPGAKDVIDSGEMPAVHLALDTVTLLPRDTVLYARLYHLVGGRWIYDHDVPFTASAEAADLLHPRAGMVLSESSMDLPFRWQPSPSATAYYLFVGTQPGLFDVINSGEMSATTITREMLRRMPLNTWLYARMHVLEHGTWRRTKDVPFRVAPEAAVLSSPANRALLIGSSLPLSWEAAPRAQAYRVDLGTTPGASDLGTSGSLAAGTTSHTFGGPLPQGRPLFVRLHSLIDEGWRHYRDREITLASAMPVPAMIYPGAGNQAVFDGARPLAWAAVPGAQAYRLLLGSSPGGSEYHDSGVIASTLRFADALPVANWLHGTLLVQINGSWISQRFQFWTGAHSGAEAPAMQAVIAASLQARGMASETHLARPGSLLEQIGGSEETQCTGYASAMVTLLRHMNLQLPVRMRSTCLITGGTECHTLVEVRSLASGEWVVFDPTFAASPVDRTSRRRLSVAETSRRVRALDFHSIDYEAHDHLALNRLRGYYVDYPLLFAHPSEWLDGEEWLALSMLEHFTPQSSSVAGPQAAYALRCVGDQAQASAVVDGVERSVACRGLDRLSSMFNANSVELTPAQTAQAALLKPRRYSLD